MPAAPAGMAAAEDGGRGGAGGGSSSSSIIEARRSREAAFYGVDAMEFSDRATQLVADFVEGALADVRGEFVQALRRRGAGAGKASKENDPEAFYDAAVTPCAAALREAVGQHMDKLADFFEMYLHRNIFKVPSPEAAAILEAGEQQQDEDAMDVDGAVGQERKGSKAGGNNNNDKKRASLSEAAAAEASAAQGLGLPASAGEVPSPRDEEGVDAALAEVRVRVRARRRQRKAVEALLGKANADLELTQKEAFALRLQVLQALGINKGGSFGGGEDSGATAGSVGEVLEALRAQGQEAAQLMAEADGLIPRLDARQRLAEGAAEEGGEADATAGAGAGSSSSSSSSKGSNSSGSSSSGAAASLAAEVKRPAIAADMSDIRAAAKEHLRGLANALAPGTRI